MGFSLDSLIALAIAVFIFSLKPGPGIMTSMSYTLSHGAKGLVAFLVGFNIGLGVYLGIVFTVLMGVSVISVDIVFIGILIKTIAAVYLIYIGIKELLKAGMPIADMTLYDNDKKVETIFDIVLSAIILTLSNPMIIVFYAALLPVFIEPTSMTLSLIAVIIGMLMIIDSFGMVIYCTPLLLFRKTLPQKFIQGVKLFSGGVIIAIGLYIGYSALFSKDLTTVF